SGMPALGRFTFLGGNDLAQRAGEIGLNKDVAYFGSCAIRIEYFFGCGPLRDEVLTFRDVLHAKLVDWETFSLLDCGLHHLSQRFGAELVQGGNAGVEHGGYRGRERTGRGNQTGFGAGVRSSFQLLLLSLPRIRRRRSVLEFVSASINKEFPRGF